jgi:hypothetical protein
MSDLTNEQIISDIRTLAVELNNVALTLSAMIDVLGVDRSALQLTAQRIMSQMLEAAAQEDAAESPSEGTSESQLTEAAVAVGGDASHPTNAVFFGG